jgi:hypothetical protein
MHLLPVFSTILAKFSSGLRSRAGAFLGTPRRSDSVVFMAASDFQRFRRRVAPPTRFIYSDADEGAVIVAAVTGGGRVVVTREVPRATLCRILEQLRSGVSSATDAFLIDELDTTVNDHYGGVSTHQILDTTIDDYPHVSLTSPISELLISDAPAPARILPFKRE